MKIKRGRIVLMTAAMMLLTMGFCTAQDMGIYAGLNLGYGQFGADVERRIPTPTVYNGGKWTYSYGTVGHTLRFNAFALTPVVGITPWRGNGSFVLERLAFEFQLAMKFAQKYNFGWGEWSATEIRPGVLAKFNFSIADWAELFGGGGPSWGDRLATYAGLGFGIPIRTGELSYSSSYKGLYTDADLPDTKTTKPGFQILMEYGVNFKVNDKFSLNWAMAGLGFVGHLTYDMTLGANYHFK